MGNLARVLKTTHFIYPFGLGLHPPLDRNLLGGKGMTLAEMASLGLPVPPGFILSTEACNGFTLAHNHFPEGLEEEIRESLHDLEKRTGRQFGGLDTPLLLSVRSGARLSMPGMMDTVLNIGLNHETLQAFASFMHNDKLAYDCYRRLIAMYANIVMGLGRKPFDDFLKKFKEQKGVQFDHELDAKNLKELSTEFENIYKTLTGTSFPKDPYEQLSSAIAAVFRSWNSERAKLYRKLHNYPDDWGTAVNVQMMVFGNRNELSATGVGFTRDPATGINHFFGEYLTNAQGEEVVAGIRTPHPINEYQKKLSHSSLSSLEEMMPTQYAELESHVKRLETHYHDMQDIEFTIEDGKLYMLQTRNGKRTGVAAIRMAVDMEAAGLIDSKTALKRVQPDQIGQLLSPIFDAKAKRDAKDHYVATGLNAGPGAASGRAAFSSEKAVEMQKQGIHCILVREESNPNDFPGLVASVGILTTKGGSTSHAAVVARGMGKPCVVGCEELHFNEEERTLTGKGKIIHEGDFLSIDGNTGEVFACLLPTSPSEIVQVLIAKTKKPEESLTYQYYEKMMEWADQYRSLRIRTNADTPQDAINARAFGAEGIGLCRTEHMFMDPKRLMNVRRLFFSRNEEERKKAIEALLPDQKSDFLGIFRAMEGLPVCIRLLDPPLHEFLPHSADEIDALSQNLHISKSEIEEIRSSLREENPMLGHRGCRLGITYPELTEMQVRAILEAAVEVAKEGIEVFPEIMVPLVASREELEHQKLLIEKTAKEVFAKYHLIIPYSIGTMIELPRAALLAGEIAEIAEFFSFGTNDLTQTTYGISRDDSAKFVPSYIQGVPHPDHPEERMVIFAEDPFQIVDIKGVGKLLTTALKEAKGVRPKLKCGVCGEHGGDPKSVQFFHTLGLDYVSCSPYRLPVARLAAAIANLTKN